MVDTGQFLCHNIILPFSIDLCHGSIPYTSYLCSSRHLIHQCEDHHRHYSAMSTTSFLPRIEKRKVEVQIKLLKFKFKKLKFELKVEIETKNDEVQI